VRCNFLHSTLLVRSLFRISLLDSVSKVEWNWGLLSLGMWRRVVGYIRTPDKNRPTNVHAVALLTSETATILTSQWIIIEASIQLEESEAPAVKSDSPIKQEFLLNLRFVQNSGQGQVFGCFCISTFGTDSNPCSNWSIICGLCRAFYLEKYRFLASYITIWGTTLTWRSCQCI
jgi:hypothetical protein